MEKVKRKEPNGEVKRELFLKSGNQCAFPGCSRFIINASGVFVGEICHIEAASEGGERFNKDSSNDKRAKFSNLLLMCHDHHKVTDNVDLYKVKRMKEIKILHEAKFSNIEQIMVDKVFDLASNNDIKLPKNLGRLDIALSSTRTEEEIQSFIKYLEDLSTLTQETMTILVMIIDHSFTRMNDLLTHTSELEIHANIPHSVLKKHTDILERKKIIWIDVDDDNISSFVIDGDSFLNDIVSFSKIAGEPLTSLLVNFDFNLFENNPN